VSAALDARGLPAGYPFKESLEITPRDAFAALKDSRLVLIDVRTEEEWRTARIDGSMHVPLHELESRFGEIEAAAAESPEKPVAFLCHHGVRSVKATLLARDRGIENASSVAGGIELWSLAADPSVARYERGPLGCRKI